MPCDCDDCVNNRDVDYDDDIINTSTYIPTPRFYGNGTPHYGVEVEVENIRRFMDNTDAAEQVITESDKFLYCKRDGSLNNGFEIVTHPFTFDWMKENWEKKFAPIFELRRRGFRSQDTDTCGMHVHIDKKYLIEDKPAFFRMMMMGYHNSDFFLRISGRKSRDEMEQWGGLDRFRRMWGKKTLSKSIWISAKSGLNNTGKYCGWNLKRHTCEARFFKGTLDPAIFQKNVEFIQSLVEFSRAKKSILLWQYLNFVSKHHHKFANLNTFLVEKGLYQYGEKLSIIQPKELTNAQPV